jgi:hypothetical protein
MVTPNYPPQLNPISLNNVKLVRAFIGAGVEVTVVTQEFSPLKYLRDDSPFWGKDTGTIIRLSPPWYAHPEKVANIAAKIRFRERTTSWFSSAAYNRCRRLIKEKAFDLIVTRSLPVDAMIVGYHLRKRFKTKWVAGINDPFPFCIDPEEPNRKKSVFDDYQKGWTRKTLSAADYVTFPSERLGRYMDRTLNLGLKERLLTLPHIGWKAPPEKPGNDKIEIVHAGTLGPNVSPMFFLWFSEKLKEHPGLVDRTRIVMFGKVHENTRNFLAEHGLDNLVTVEKPVSYKESLRRIARATAVLLIEFCFEEGILLLSKFADYAVSGKPMLLFSPEVGTNSDLVGGYSHQGFLGQDEEKVKYGIDRFLRRLDKGESLDDYSCPRPENFEPEQVARTLLAKL